MPGEKILGGERKEQMICVTGGCGEDLRLTKYRVAFAEMTGDQLWELAHTNKPVGIGLYRQDLKDIYEDTPADIAFHEAMRRWECVER